MLRLRWRRLAPTPSGSVCALAISGTDSLHFINVRTGRHQFRAASLEDNLRPREAFA